MRGVNFESFAKFMFEGKTSIYAWVHLQYSTILSAKEASSSFNCLDHDKVIMESITRYMYSARYMVNDNSYARIRVSIMNRHNRFVDFFIWVENCWSKFDIQLYTSISLGNAQFFMDIHCTNNEPYTYLTYWRKYSHWLPNLEVKLGNTFTIMLSLELQTKTI